MRRRNWSVLALAPMVALALAPATSDAQVFEAPVVQPARHWAGAAGVYGQPLGVFGQNVKRSFGLDGAAIYGVDARGIFGIRGELGFQNYSTKSEPFYANTQFGLVELESETKSGVLTLGIGPQLSAPEGPIRPYVAGTVGLARFATNTSINLPAHESNTGQKETLDQQTVSSDFIMSLAATAGIAFRVPMLGRGIMIDVGARYHRNGEAKYVSPEGVQYDGSATPVVTPTESEANFVVYRLGIVVPIR